MFELASVCEEVANNIEDHLTSRRLPLCVRGSLLPGKRSRDGRRSLRTIKVSRSNPRAPDQRAVVRGFHLVTLFAAPANRRVLRRRCLLCGSFRTQLAGGTTSGMGRCCRKSRKSNHAKNLANGDFWTTPPLRCFVVPIRKSVVVFLRRDVVPHVAAHITHQQL
jgi:hypothetical protein